ncbi:Dicer-like protein 1 [Elasticomyces elasticus]|nr:Dicer-like protein 1 [Elasticomyces elasticus]
MDMEKAARKDAAFQAYSGLYTVCGLLNELLLLLCQEWGPIADFVELEPGRLQVTEQLDVWSTVDQSLSGVMPRYHSHIRMVDESNDEDIVCLTLITSGPILLVPPVRVKWSETQMFRINVAASVASAPPDSTELALLRETTLTIYGCSRSRRRKEYYEQDAIANQKIVRAPLPNRPPFIFHGWLFGDEDPLRLACEPMRQHLNLMPLGRDHSQHGKQMDADDGKRPIFSAAQCEVDRMDIRYVRFSLSMPRFFCHITDFMTAHALRVTIVREVPFRDLEHTVTAIRAPSSNRETNYQYHEFVGDTVLKFVVSQFLYASQPHWPEGFLIKRRVHLVSNERLAFEALRMGLDRFIITEPTRYRTWAPPSRSFTASDGSNAAYESTRRCSRGIDRRDFLGQ